MAQRTKAVLKTYFETGDKPTQHQFEDLIDSMVSAGFAFMGIAAPTTNPGTPDQKMVYIAVEPGTYTNFGNLVVAEGEVALLKWDSTWTKEVTGIATAAQLNQLGQKANNNKIELRDLTKKTYNIFDCYDYIEKHLYLYPSSPIAENNYTRTLIIPFNVVSGDYFLFYVNGKSGTSKINGLKAGITSSIPSAGDTPSQVITTGMSSVYYRGGFEVSVNGSYVLLQFKYIETYTQQEIDADFAIVVDNLILVKANNSEETYDDYPYIQGRITDVQMENLSQEIKDKFVQTTQSVIYQETRKVYVGSNLLGSATSLGAGWSEDNGVYSHASSNSIESLAFATTVEDGDICLLNFYIDVSGNEVVKVGIGDAYQILTYNGTHNIVVPVKAINGTTLYFTPTNKGNVFSISNIRLRKIQETGEEVILEQLNTYTDNHHQNYGAWNVLLGDNTAENAIGSTRSVAIGLNSLRDLQGGHRNVGVGSFAMRALKGGEGNVSIGSDSMYQVQRGDGNVVAGLGALSYAAEAKENVTIGKYAMQNAEVRDATIEKNVAIGKGAGYRTTGEGNTMVGYEAGYRNKTGKYNVIVGGASLGSTDGGDKNTLIGSQIHTTTSIHDSVGLGCKAIPTKSNQMMLGSTDVTEVVMCGNKKIIFNQDGTVTWEVVS